MFWPLTSCSLTVCRRTVFFHLLKNPYFIKAYTLWMFSFYTQVTCTILFQTRANQLICSSVFSRLSLFGTKRNANTNTLNKETYLYHSFYKSLHLHLLLNHTRCKTLWARKMAVFRASRVLLLHNIPFQMQITTADQPLANSFSLFCRDFFVLPWQLWATVLLSVMQNLGIADPADRFKRIWNQKDKARFAGYLIIQLCSLGGEWLQWVANSCFLLVHWFW